MLEQLVHEIRAGGTLEAEKLATRLGTTPRMLEAMLEHLQRMGVIRDYAPCLDGCQHCSLQEACNKKSPSLIRVWQSRTDI